MKIAFISKINSSNADMEEMAINLALLEHEIFVYAPQDLELKKIANYKKIHIIKFPKFLENNFYLLSSLHAIFGLYDVVNFQQPLFSSWLIKLFNWKTKVVTTLSQSTQQSIALNAADKIIANNQEIYSELQKKHAHKTISIPVGNNIRINNKTNLISQWALKTKRYLLASATLTKENDIHFLIEAFKQLEDSAKVPNNFKLAIYGKFIDSEYEKYLRTITAGRQNIVFVPMEKEKIFGQLFSHAYLFVQTAEEDREANLLLAMNYGLATLAASNSNSDILCEGGYSFQAKSVDSLRDRLAYLINRSDEVAKSAELAKLAFMRQYSWQSVAQRTFEEAYLAKSSSSKQNLVNAKI